MLAVITSPRTCSQTKDTKGMVNGDSIQKMKDGVRILNFARGALVDSPALLEALEKGKVAAYATDFPTDSMLGTEGIVALPHLGASTPESEDNCAVMAVDQIKDYLENGNILNSVNLPSISMAREAGTKRICIIHKNVPNTIALFASTCGEAGINIENMQSKSKGEYAYTILDVSGDLSPAAVDALRRGQAVILPTDTVFGLAVAPRYASDPGILYRLKGRPSSKPVAWLVAGPADLDIYGALTVALGRWDIEAEPVGGAALAPQGRPGKPAGSTGRSSSGGTR